MRTTPTTPGGRRALDGEPAVIAVIRAWTEPGTNPAWHRASRRDLHQSMPLLARALDRLAIEHREARAVNEAAAAAAEAAAQEQVRQALPLWQRALEARVGRTGQMPAVPEPPRVLPRVEHDGPWLSAEEVADVFGTSRQQVREWTQRGVLYASRTPGGQPAYLRTDVADLLDQNTHRGGENA